MFKLILKMTCSLKLSRPLEEIVSAIVSLNPPKRPDRFSTSTPLPRLGDKNDSGVLGKSFALRENDLVCRRQVILFSGNDFVCRRQVILESFSSHLRSQKMTPFGVISGRWSRTMTRIGVIFLDS